MTITDVLQVFVRWDEVEEGEWQVYAIIHNININWFKHEHVAVFCNEQSCTAVTLFVFKILLAENEIKGGTSLLM